jgi:hypothetical protein
MAGPAGQDLLRVDGVGVRLERRGQDHPAAGDPRPAGVGTRRMELCFLIALAAGIALVTVWAGIAASYRTNWPLGFFAGVIAAGSFLLGQGWGTVRRRGPARAQSPSPLSRTAAWCRSAPSPIPARAVACQQSPPPVRDKGVSS